MASQCSHAAVACYKEALKTNRDLVAVWESQGQPKIIVRAEQPGERGLTAVASAAARHKITAIIVRDAGRTQVAQGTPTVIGVGPGPADAIDKITGSLRLF